MSLAPAEPFVRPHGAHHRRVTVTRFVGDDGVSLRAMCSWVAVDPATDRHVIVGQPVHVGAVVAPGAGPEAERVCRERLLDSLAHISGWDLADPDVGWVL